MQKKCIKQKTKKKNVILVYMKIFLFFDAIRG